MPTEAIDAYKTATEWEKFTNINPIPTPASSITLNLNEVSLEIDDTVQLIATVMPADATDMTVTWSSADEAVAKVDAEGMVTAVGEGTTIITATTAEGLTAECSVSVKDSLGVYGIYDDGVRVAVNGGLITVSGAGDKFVRILTADGNAAYTAQGNCQASVAPGIYLVVVGDTVTKVVAKY